MVSSSVPKNVRAEQRRLKAAQLRKAEASRRRRRRILWGSGGALAALVVAGVIVALAVQPHASGPSSASGLDAAAQIIPSAPTGAATTQQSPTTVPDTSGIDGALAWDTTGWPGDGSAHPGALEHDHVTGPVGYAVTPPVGGPHDPIWMNAGVYTKPVPTERAVHNLEHGAVWITYDPDLPAAQVRRLVALVGHQSLIPETGGVAGQANRYMDLSPWASNTLPSPIVISSWGHQLRVDKAGDPRLQRFIDTFRHNAAYSPEFGAAVDGVPVQTGGVPAAYGSAKPNPPGTASE